MSEKICSLQKRSKKIKKEIENFKKWAIENFEHLNDGTLKSCGCHFKASIKKEHYDDIICIIIEKKIWSFDLINSSENIRFKLRKEFNKRICDYIVGDESTKADWASLYAVTSHSF